MTERKTELRGGNDGTGGWSLTVVFSPERGARTRVLRLTESLIALQRNRDGRANSIALEDPAVSQDCVSLRRLTDAPGFELVDNSSRNPVRVNGRVVRRHILEENDVVRVGNTLLVFDREPPPRVGHHRTGSLDTGRLHGLLERLCIFGSTAGQLLQIDAALVPHDCRCLVVWTPGPMEARMTADWFAETHERPMRTVEAIDQDAANRIRECPAGEVLLLDRLDFAQPQRMIELGRALRERVDGHVQSLSVISLPLDRRHDPPPLIDQTLGLIAQFELCIPPLSDRRADILPALEARLRAHAVSLKPSTLTVDFAEHMLCYGWPGELAEIRRNALWMGGLIQRGDPLNSNLLPEPMRGGKVHVQQDNSMLRIDHDAVLEAMREFDGNVSAVASHFGYSRAYFYRVLRNENIDIARIREALKKENGA